MRALAWSKPSPTFPGKQAGEQGRSIFVQKKEDAEMRHRDEDDYWDHWDQDRMDFEDPWSELYAAI